MAANPDDEKQKLMEGEQTPAAKKSEKKDGTRYVYRILVCDASSASAAYRMNQRVD